MNQASNPKEVIPSSVLRHLLAYVRSRTGVLAITTAGNFVVRTGSSVLLTRLLTPHDFGIIGIIGSVFFAVTMITDLGFEAFIIRHVRADDRYFLNVLWTMNLKRGLALFIVIAITSPLIAWLFGKPVIALPLAVAAVNFFINGSVSLSILSALRHDKSRELAFLEFGLQIFQTIACILLALWWRNVWSMIAAMILQNVLRSLLSYGLFPNSGQKLQRDFAISREFLSFSRLILMSSALTLFIGQIDKLFLGRLFTLSEFGLYAIGITIASAPAAFCDSYARRIVLPVYARTWREAPEALASVYYGARRIPSYLYAFACGGLVGSAPLVVAVLYDPRYTAASKFISFLMIATALRLPNITASEFVTALGEMRQMLRINIVRVIWLALALPLGFYLFGGMGVVGAVGLVEVPAMFYCWAFLRRLGVLDLRQEGAYLGLVVAGALIGWLFATEALTVFPRL